jgi:hypothetical protein
VFAVVELNQRYFAVGVNVGLLVEAPDPFDIADVVGVLAAEITGVFSFNLAVGLFFFSGLF